MNQNHFKTSQMKIHNLNHWFFFMSLSLYRKLNSKSIYTTYESIPFPCRLWKSNLIISINLQDISIYFTEKSLTMAVVKRLNINSILMLSRKLIYTVVILKFIEVLFKVLRRFSPWKIFPYNMEIKLTLHWWWYGMCVRECAHLS